MAQQKGQRGELTEAERARIEAWNREHWLASHPDATPAEISRALAPRAKRP